MGKDRNGPLINGMAAFGFIVLLAMAANTAFVKIPDMLWPEEQTQSTTESTSDEKDRKETTQD